MGPEIVAESCDCLLGQSDLSWREVLAAELFQDTSLKVEPLPTLVEKLVVVKLDCAARRPPTAAAPAIEVGQTRLQRHEHRPLIVGLLSDLGIVWVHLVEVSDALWEVGQEAKSQCLI